MLAEARGPARSDPHRVGEPGLDRALLRERQHRLLLLLLLQQRRAGFFGRGALARLLAGHARQLGALALAQGRFLLGSTRRPRARAPLPEGLRPAGPAHVGRGLARAVRGRVRLRPGGPCARRVFERGPRAVLDGLKRGPQRRALLLGLAAPCAPEWPRQDAPVDDDVRGGVEGLEAVAEETRARVGVQRLVLVDRARHQRRQRHLVVRRVEVGLAALDARGALPWRLLLAPARGRLDEGRVRLPGPEQVRRYEGVVVARGGSGGGSGGDRSGARGPLAIARAVRLGDALLVLARRGR